MAKPKSLPYEAPEPEQPYSVTLHSTAGGADKIYSLSIERRGDGWVVNYANGRRGGTMATGAKTKSPVGYADARKSCNTVLFDKVGGGYLPIAGSHFGEGMSAEAIATAAREASGYVPQLLVSIEDDEIERYVTDDDWIAEPKHDGERRFLIVKDGAISGGNRKGQTVALPKAITEAATFDRDLVLDGEQIGDRFVFWDILTVDGLDLRTKPWHDREAVMAAGEFNREPAIFRTVTATTTEAKRKLVADERTKGGEGVVFKRRNAQYDPGRPGSDATWFKYKFWKSLSAVVGKVNDKRSIGLDLVDEGGARIQVGNVTIPANKEVPGVGAVVEVAYLYAFDGGSLFQPTYLGERSDIDVAECLASQRVFKAEEPSDDASVGMRM